jgi:hypothetical protein
MRRDGRMDILIDMTKLITAFRNFANAPEKITKFRRRHMPPSAGGMAKGKNLHCRNLWKEPGSVNGNKRQSRWSRERQAKYV